jgi:hypothetical protein
MKTEEENRIHMEIEVFLRKEQQVSHQNLLSSDFLKKIPFIKY